MDLFATGVGEDIIIKHEENTMKQEVPIWEKSNLTLEEAAAYSGIGIGTLRRLSSREGCNFVLWVGKKRLIKRKKLDQFLEKDSTVRLL